MTGLEFENKVEELLIKYKKTYTREGTKINYGHRAGKGKFDFKLLNNAIECKSIGKLNNLTIPGINPKTHKPYTSTRIHSHQLKALRAFNGTGYLLIHESDSNTCYALTTKDFDNYLISHDMPRTLSDIYIYGIDLEEFIKGVD